MNKNKWTLGNTVIQMMMNNTLDYERSKMFIAWTILCAANIYIDICNNCQYLLIESYGLYVYIFGSDCSFTHLQHVRNLSFLSPANSFSLIKFYISIFNSWIFNNLYWFPCAIISLLLLLCACSSAMSLTTTCLKNTIQTRYISIFVQSQFLCCSCCYSG